MEGIIIDGAQRAAFDFFLRLIATDAAFSSLK